MKKKYKIVYYTCNILFNTINNKYLTRFYSEQKILKICKKKLYVFQLKYNKKSILSFICFISNNYLFL